MIHSGKIWTYLPDIPMEEILSPSFEWRFEVLNGASVMVRIKHLLKFV
jgi:hypothetical protein